MSGPRRIKSRKAGRESGLCYSRLAPFRAARKGRSGTFRLRPGRSQGTRRIPGGARRRAHRARCRSSRPAQRNPRRRGTISPPVGLDG